MSTNELLYNRKDHSSFANSDEVVSTDIKLEWTLDFENHRIWGSCDHIVKVLIDNASTVVFDTRDIHLLGDILVNNKPVSFILGETHPVLGTKIVVDIPAELRKKDTLFSVHFPYRVDPSASAVQWLEPSATAGGKFPYVFTQCQAIHARSLFPCMDSPGIKTPYSAKVTAPKWCTVLMSALASSYVTETNTENSDVKVFHWTQPVPTSPYLVALAAGNLSSLDISPRVRIWSEPEVIVAAHNEFAETEDFVAAAEVITGCAYQWNRYDVVCLPPSFPYGGMENPCLTFATPTLLAGDRSLADVIAHEIAHSWTGNLVSNHVWDHFWLNEGWTVWLERKITSRVKHNDEVGKLSAEIGLVHLNENIQHFGTENKFTQLVWPLRGEDPDDAFSSIPYEKGFNLLNYLENLVGSENFDAFVKSYINEFKFKTVTTGEFRDHFVTVMTQRLSAPADADTSASSVSSSGKKNKKNKNKNKNEKSEDNLATAAQNEANQQLLQTVTSLDWNDLFLSPGYPKYNIDFKNSLSLTAKVLARHWYEIAKDTNNLKFTPSKSDIMGWSSQQICLFLDTLLDYSQQASPFTVSFLEQLNSYYQFNDSKNAEIRLRWQSLGLKANAPWIVPQVIDFITSQGRMKFVRPLYRLFRQSEGGELANEVFEKNKMMYHPIARKMLESDLQRLNEASKKQEEQLKQEQENLKTEIVREEEEETEEAPKTKGRTFSGGNDSVSSMPDLEPVTVVVGTEEIPKEAVKPTELKKPEPVVEEKKGVDPLWEQVKAAAQAQSTVPPPAGKVKEDGRPTYSAIASGAVSTPADKKSSTHQHHQHHSAPVKHSEPPVAVVARPSFFRSPLFITVAVSALAGFGFWWLGHKKR